MRIIHFLENEDVTKKILMHLGLREVMLQSPTKSASPEATLSLIKGYLDNKSPIGSRKRDGETGSVVNVRDGMVFS